MNLKISTILWFSFGLLLVIAVTNTVISPIEASLGISTSWRIVLFPVIVIAGLIFLIFTRPQKQRPSREPGEPLPRPVLLGCQILLYSPLLAIFGCFGTNFVIMITTHYVGNTLLGYSLLGGAGVGCITILFLVVRYSIDRRRNDLY